ncbi:MAG: zinc-ribbon domain-containing protein [Chloroflexi bacterium]|nr:zinc-ribbon domain-containing protein [Chloroflexota bacterium]
MASVKFHCTKCGKEIEPNQKPCPFCGCSEAKIVAVMSDDTVEAKETSKLMERRKGFKRPIREVIQGWFPSISSRFKKGVDKVRVIDRENDEYHETVKDASTGEVTREVHEPLTQHRNPPVKH